MTIRYIISPDNLAYITLLGSGQKFVVQAPYFRKLLGLHPRAALGSTSVDCVQLRQLGVIPSRKEAAADVSA
jgi:hypothetical protein